MFSNSKNFCFMLFLSTIYISAKIIKPYFIYVIIIQGKSLVSSTIKFCSTYIDRVSKQELIMLISCVYLFLYSGIEEIATPNLFRICHLNTRATSTF